MSIDRLMDVQQRIAELSESGIVTDELDELRAERGALEMSLGDDLEGLADYRGGPA